MYRNPQYFLLLKWNQTLMGQRAVLCSGDAGEGAIELCAEGSRYLKAAQAGFPARASVQPGAAALFSAGKWMCLRMVTACLHIHRERLVLNECI